MIYCNGVRRRKNLHFKKLSDLTHADSIGGKSSERKVKKTLRIKESIC